MIVVSSGWAWPSVSGHDRVLLDANQRLAGRGAASPSIALHAAHWLRQRTPHFVRLLAKTAVRGSRWTLEPPGA